MPTLPNPSADVGITPSAFLLADFLFTIKSGLRTVCLAYWLRKIFMQFIELYSFIKFLFQDCFYGY